MHSLQISALSTVSSFVFFLIYFPLSAAASPSLSGCSVFPNNNIWNTTITSLPVAAGSNEFIVSMGSDTGVHADFGSGTWDGAPIGIPITVVDSSQPLVSVSFDYTDESDPGPYPVPADAAIEGGPLGDGDRHILLLNKDNCLLYELFYAWPQGDGSWHAGSGALFDLGSHSLRPEGWTSADAAGLPILPGLVRYEELAAGYVGHAIRFTAAQTRKHHVWPARHDASSLTASSYPPMGQRFRLKQGVDVSGFSPLLQVLLQAMKTYGLILADNGSDWYISGVPDERWDNDMLRELRNLKGSDFEAVDVSSQMEDPNSGKVKGEVGGSAKFYPLSPCRILDSRISGGKLTAGLSRAYYVSGNDTEIQSQGGAGNCGVPSTARAVVINLTSTEALGNGHFRIYPFNSVFTTASIVNFNNGVTMANATEVPICQPACAFDINIYSSVDSHAVGDVMGYFE